jgi:hypothetical protein
VRRLTSRRKSNDFHHAERKEAATAAASATTTQPKSGKEARQTERLVEQHGRKCLLIDGDIGNEKFCRKAIEQTVDEFGKIAPQRGRIVNG